MRLINTTSLEIQEFRNDNIPRYAILSHTWDEVEITLQDMKGPGASKKKGYEKLKRC